MEFMLLQRLREHPALGQQGRHPAVGRLRGRVSRRAEAAQTRQVPLSRVC